MACNDLLTIAIDEKKPRGFGPSRLVLTSQWKQQCKRQSLVQYVGSVSFGSARQLGGSSTVMVNASLRGVTWVHPMVAKASHKAIVA